MRPIVSKKAFMQYPLNEVLGTEANIRILRLLAIEVDAPLSIPDIADRVGISIVGVRKAFKKLINTGFIINHGGGKSQLYSLRHDEPLTDILITLFQDEKQRHVRFLDLIRKKIRMLEHSPRSVWIQESPQKSGDSLNLGFSQKVRYISKTFQDFRDSLTEIEKEYDTTIELHGYTKAELINLPMDNITLLHGIPPKLKDMEPASKKVKTHKELDQDSMNRSRNLSLLIEEDPSLIFRAKNYLDQKLKEEVGSAQRDLSEWKNILDSYSIHRLKKFLIAETERATRLRQSNPFYAILNSEEKKRILGEI